MIRSPVLVVAVIFAAFSQVAADTFDDLCAPKPVELTTKAQILALAKQAALARPGTCADNVATALRELGALVSESEAHLCQLDGAQRFKDFYLEHLDGSGVDGAAGARMIEKHLPQSLRVFAVAFGMRLSNVCAWRMYESLYGPRALTTFSKTEHDQLNRLIGDKTPLANLVDAVLQPGQFITPQDLANLLGSPLFSNGKLYVQMEHVAYVRDLKKLCASDLEPVYKALFLPTHVLNSAGFDYRDAALKTRLDPKDSLRWREKGQYWSRVVFLCEGLKMVEPLECPPGDQHFRLLPRGEAEQFEQSNSDAEKRAGANLSNVKEIDPKTALFEQIKDVIFDERDAALMKAMKRLKLDKATLDRQQARKIRRAMERLIHGKTKASLMSAVKTMRSGFSSKKKGPEPVDLHEKLMQIVKDTRDPSELTGMEQLRDIAELAGIFTAALLFAIPALIVNIPNFYADWKDKIKPEQGIRKIQT